MKNEKSRDQKSKTATGSGRDSSDTPVLECERVVSTPTRHVLLIEDDPVILELLQDVLSAAGFRVLIAKTAADGLELFQEFSESTFCIILDYGIPGMHASRLLERLVDVDEEVKVILSSGYPQNFVGEDFPLDRCAGFMAKPYDPQILISELERLRTIEAEAVSR